ncbi:hypothetical protein B0I72DRAFT_165938 [Yarrowia lipolytica]|uniref:YALI0F25443p n=2 Tax=Yarrowia lipolytica TaxID=4952 RepID=Q6C0E5_YARLI|nr:YALI0F25443p [Yarrowia lipolytica CLIB122]AOW07688.1 hypothetical protein YALI1_F32688g [Yarrowia lipolytica]KAB8284497.1 hypothetical protein BKA91DRAFT_134906 [Yarrowia lipolytica]KAE8174462.1 hypothetical protein BKA90DRAFT_166573 [Yarrowia lipolytica]KAJ8055251.1 hypothetical protein LXG23DRAFT_56793 [Yarrowia lipolytica]QNP99415.1 NAP1-binding protein 2 [Yarrowia lipolytica]|eukprot:XP_505867.1 YALI0F25443p [Yarrowia lipolytica CLIB122]
MAENTSQEVLAPAQDVHPVHSVTQDLASVSLDNKDTTEPIAHKLRISTQRLSTLSDLGESRDSPSKPYPAEQSPYYRRSRPDLSESSRRGSRISQSSSDPLKLELAALQFHSSLDYAIVRDFGYPPQHPLFFGARQSMSVVSSSLDEDDDLAYPPGIGEGPPYYEDSDVDAELDSELNGRAVALFDFEPENDNEIGLFQGQIVWVHYRHGQGWLVAMNLDTEETGLIPEEYVQILGEDEVVSHGLDGEEDEEEASAAAAVSSAAAALMAKEDQNHEEVGEMELETDAGSVVSEDQTVTGEDDKPELS